ncbi:PREDICTED: anaphase-promoting complex subunit 1-like isoform X2 [Amphimedon queenslandica]|uniref:Uncharacterized protein n=1 Tax=Amphimedon queenslandica TaxID=400682 RepID=A0A1X7VD23_AMPQE|nr:PREDICTED: anaphase-promoting complex subunit 1-like isoform X2 [Amphimedon queenslandica]|eukprot:XP_019849502.1 PREDICTED: anaphase-promoting complex subunit 1-like isoform X2 [Amphimedon queenslandica]
MEVLYKCNSPSASQNTDYWSISEKNGGETDHLLVLGCSVKVFKGSDAFETLKNVFTVHSPILQALWVWFKDDDSKGAGPDGYMKCLCLREQGQLNIIMNNGTFHTLPLPFNVRGMWYVNRLLLIERSVPDTEVTDGLSVLFTISHPMEDITPVTSRKISYINGQKGTTNLSYVTSPQLRVATVISDHTPPLVLTYDTRDNTHTLWAIQTATSNDIPSPSSTPGGVAGGVASRSRGAPLSSSAPERITQYSGSPIQFNLDITPDKNEKKRSLLTPLHEESLRNATIKRLQSGGVATAGITRTRKGSVSFTFSPSPSLARKGEVSVASSSRPVSGRSPFVNRYSRTRGGAVRTPLSPVLQYSRISPYSKLHPSMALLYNNNNHLLDNFETLLPQICLHQQWAELPDLDCMMYHSAVDAFVCKDFKKEKYFVYYIPELSQIRILSLTKLFLGDISVYSDEYIVISNVSSAINLININMILILINGSLELYTGPYKITNIDLSPLYEIVGRNENGSMGMSLSGNENGMSLSGNGNLIESIVNPVGNEFNIITTDNDIYHCSILPIAQSHTISLCIDGICSIVPADVINSVFISYYNSALSLANEWIRFENWLLSVLGLTNTDTDADFVSDPILVHDPLLKLLKVDVNPPSVGGAKRQEVGVVSNALLKDYLNRVATCLHLIYEELKLNINNNNKTKNLGVTLYKISHCLGWLEYKDHYFRDNPSLLTDINVNGLKMVNEVGVALYDVTTPPPSVYQCLYQLMNERRVMHRYPLISGVCKRSEQIMKIYQLLTNNWWNSDDQIYYQVFNNEDIVPMETSTNNGVWLDKLLQFITSEGLTPHLLDTFPVGVALPIKATMGYCRRNPNTLSWKPESLLLIGRDDVYDSVVGEREKPRGEEKGGGGGGGGSVRFEIQRNNDNGMSFDDEVLKVRFSTDMRVNEVKRLLTSSEPARINLEQKPEVSDHDFLEEQELHLLSLCQRTMSLPVGRGMFTLATSEVLPTSSLNIPKLNLLGRIPPRNNTIGLDHIDKPAHMSDWPLFHNGVAAGIKLYPSSDSKLDSTWVVYNQPEGGVNSEEGFQEYSGFLMALGLHGHLSSLPSFNTFEYLQNKQELTVIGLLIGLSADKCGSMDLSLISLLSLYFPPLLPPDSVDLDISTMIQTAAVIGLGLVYMSSCNRFMIELMINEIGHSPGPECRFGLNRESYSLSAGLALGMIGLASGDNSVIKGLNIVNQLRVYINGGMKRDVSAIDTSSSSQLVLEGKHVNVHVTAPGGILALSLIYLKTNNEQIASYLAPPTTLYHFECVQYRPDYLCLRTLGASLILWDSIEPTQSWIDGNIPRIAHEYSFKSNEANPSLYQLMSQSYLFILTGCCFAIGLKYAGTSSTVAKNILFEQYKKIVSHQTEHISKYCVETCTQSVLLSLSMVLSGTGDLSVLKLIRKHHTILSTNENASNSCYGYQMATHMSLGLLFLGGGRYSLTSDNKSIVALLCSLYPHYPSSSTDNRYHCQALRHLYVLAAAPRVLITRDINNNESVSVPLTLHCTDNGSESGLEVWSPCLLPDWNRITAIEIKGTRYSPVKYELNENIKSHLIRYGTIFVKLLNGYCSYESDPLGQKSLLSLALMSPTHYQLGGVIGQLNISSEAFNDKHINQICDIYCRHGNEFHSSALLETISNDEKELLSIFLQLEEISNELNINNHLLWQLKLCYAYSANISPVHESLRDYIETIIMKTNKMISKSVSPSLLLNYLIDNKLTGGISDINILSLFINLTGLPFIKRTGEGTDITSVISLLVGNEVNPKTIVDVMMCLSVPH